MNILIAEVQKSHARILSRKITQKLGCTPVTVHSGKEAREQIMNTDKIFSLAVLDASMPDAENGGIVETALSRNIPVIAIISSDDMEHKEKIIEKGITDYVIRGAGEDIDYLVSQIQRVLNNQKMKVLVVDDAVTYRVGIKDMLKAQLFEVFDANDGIEALKVLDEHPDTKIVLTDYNMPNMDGYELVSRIRKKHSKDRLAIIVISGAAEKEIATRFLKLGANDYIQKPFSREEFNCRVNINAEHIELIENINNMANRDFLTGLFNRRYFFSMGEPAFKQAVRKGQRISVAMVDIDFFKKINDTYGHDAGDMVIKGMADLLTENARQGDITARFGGEEFCIFSTGSGIEEIKSFLENLRASAEKLITKFSGQKITFTISVGLCTEAKKTLGEMIIVSDEKLYEAKEGGRNRVCY